MSRELALLLEDGTVIRDEGWRCVADVAKSFHGFGVKRVYGVVVDAETMEQVYPKVIEPSTTATTSPLLG